jgi:hypothetical protein
MANYCQTLTIAAPAAANIALDTTISVSPLSPVAGSSVTLTGTLRNTGTIAGSATVYANMGTPPVSMTSQTYSNIAANGGTAAVSLTFTVPAATTGGSYQFCLTM